MITGRQIREARALLGWTRSKLAAKVGTVTTLTIMRAEEVDDEPPIPPDQAVAIRRALERAGVDFTSGGARLRSRKPPTPAPSHPDRPEPA